MVEPSAANQTIRKFRWVRAPASRCDQLRGASGSASTGLGLGRGAVDTAHASYRQFGGHPRCAAARPEALGRGPAPVSEVRHPQDALLDPNFRYLIAFYACPILGATSEQKANMRSAAIQRLESLLQAKRLAQTLPRPEHLPEDAASTTGIAALDTALEGGWRRGEVSEILGRPSTGRTAVLVTTLAAATARGEIVALVDPFDQFDPVTASAAGLDLDRVLWVRGTSLIGGALAGRPAHPVVRSHPFARARLIEDAVSRGVRAVDLIVRAGGFGVAALDLADVPSRVLSALPFTTWLRLAHANEGQRTVCLLVADGPVGRSARGASIQLDASRQWTGASRQSRRLAGFEVRARIAQARQGVDREPTWTLCAVC